MAALETLFQQYSIETIIILLVVIVVAFKFLSELWEWIYTKVKGFFDKKNEKQKIDEDQQTNIANLEKLITEDIKQRDEKHQEIIESIEELRFQQKNTTDRLQENTRSFIIDKHHYFCYQVGAIDDMNLQSLERRYMYYKADGGDSFVDQLMEEIRELPKVNLQNKLLEIERDGIM